ncbi:hypothetical protein [Citrobacter amalonaticus]|uniref:hypothetical protein n=1 Tax=Citrobacter amalonaticus TaxID=35703 RepID=UPI001907A59B|nr:hypothetical protein [Citrobacter amalonaticus]MBJ9080230.1 hypothetical protein [Citrobacter amalonaticus]MBW0871053.1 hypothetical protein [Citrobacter amalonaticus]
MYQDEYTYVTMPMAFSREDAPWIKEQLATLPAGMREKIAVAYAQAYQEAFEAEPVSFRQQNAARRNANRRLREFCTRYTPAARGYTSLPPRV